MMEIVVLFPAPFGPKNAKKSPSFTSNDIPLTASDSAYDFRNPLTETANMAVARPHIRMKLSVLLIVFFSGYDVASGEKIHLAINRRMGTGQKTSNGHLLQKELLNSDKSAKLHIGKCKNINML